MSIESQVRADAEAAKCSMGTAVRQAEEASPGGGSRSEPQATGDAGSAGIGESPNTQAYAIDFTTIAHTVKQALEIRLALPERWWVDSMTAKLRGHLALLIDDDIWDVETPQSRELLKTARELFSDDARPNETTPPGFAYEYMRALALATRTAAAVYRLRLVDRVRKAQALGGDR